MGGGGADVGGLGGGGGGGDGIRPGSLTGAGGAVGATVAKLEGGGLSGRES
jgi:hypothetical protein